MLNLIAAIAADNAIGHQNRLLFHLPDDMRRFKTLTTGHTVVMGRKTFDSFPKGALPNRRNIVLSHDTTLTLPGAEVYASLDDALAACKDDEQVFVIGGASLYAQALPLADRLFLTHVHATPAAADTFFPALDLTQWELTATEDHAADERHAVPFTFSNYTRRAEPQLTRPTEDTVVAALMQHGWHISFAESCTGGMAAARLINVANASSVLAASFVTYAAEAKTRYAHVSPDTIATYGIVSEEVALEMAVGVARQTGAEVGVGITGIAGPGGGNAEKPVGMVCFGISIQGDVHTYTARFGDLGRNAVRAAATDFVFTRLAELLS